MDKTTISFEEQFMEVSSILIELHAELRRIDQEILAIELMSPLEDGVTFPKMNLLPRMPMTISLKVN